MTTVIRAPAAAPDRQIYRHYGLTLEVNERLARATAVVSSEANVRVEFLGQDQVAPEGLPWEPAGVPGTWRAQTSSGSWLRLRYALEGAWAEFVIDDRGESVWISRSANVLLDEAAELFLGPVFSCLATQRGLTCLHASVVRLDDRVIAVVGPSGAGKSTTALALVQHGGGVFVSDDVAMLSGSGDRIVVAAGAPRIRVRATPAMSLLGTFESLEPVWSEQRPVEPKRYFPIQRSVLNSDTPALPLDVIYFLEPWSDAVTAPSVREAKPASALPRLMAQRHMAQAIDSNGDKRDFELLARLLRTAPVRELLRPAGIETTEQTVATLVSDAHSLL